MCQIWWLRVALYKGRNECAKLLTYAILLPKHVYCPLPQAIRHWRQLYDLPRAKLVSSALNEIQLRRKM